MKLRGCEQTQKEPNALSLKSRNLPRVWKEMLRGAAERKKVDSVHLSPHLSFDLWLIPWPLPTS